MLPGISDATLIETFAAPAELADAIEIELTHAASRLAAVAAAIVAVRVDFIVTPFREHRSAIPGANAFY